MTNERIVELREWVNNCGEVIPGKPYFSSDRRSRADLLAILGDYEKFKAEREELQEQYAQLESSCYDNGFPTGGSVFSELGKAEAELTRYAPLIEAALNPEWPAHMYQNNDLARAALACREGK